MSTPNPKTNEVVGREEEEDESGSDGNDPGLCSLCFHYASVTLLLCFDYALIMFMLCFYYVYRMLMLCFCYVVVAFLSCYCYVFTSSYSIDRKSVV